MARYTPAYSSFILHLNEVGLLCRAAASKEKEDPFRFSSDINTFCRAAIVLLSAHLEAYIEELGEIALTNIHLKSFPRDKIPPQLYYHISKDKFDEMFKTSDPARIANKVFTFIEQDSHYWSKVGPFLRPLPIDRFNKDFSNPNFDKIKAYFNRFGFSNFQHDLTIHLRAKFLVTKNMVNHLIDTRNKIAHGDHAVTKTPTDIKDMISITKIFCRSTDVVFAFWCKKNLCTIR